MHVDEFHDFNFAYLHLKIETLRRVGVLFKCESLKHSFVLFFFFRSGILSAFNY